MPTDAYLDGWFTHRLWLLLLAFVCRQPDVAMGHHTKTSPDARAEDS